MPVRVRDSARLHGIVSLELGGHLAATGIGADIVFEAELQTIHSQAVAMSPARLQPRD